MNDENLITQAQRTPEERREIARLGGIASGEAKREKKVMEAKLAAYFEHKDLTSYFDAMMERKDNVTMALLSKAIDSLDGHKLDPESGTLISEFVKQLRQE